MIKFYNKLVRSNVPKEIQECGNTAITTEISGKTHDLCLAAKLIEESKEFYDAVNSGDDSKMIEELADIEEILDIIYMMSKLQYRFDREDVKSTKLIKRRVKGSLAGGTYLIAVEEKDK